MDLLEGAKAGRSGGVMHQLPLSVVGQVEVGADGEHLLERPHVGVGGSAVQRRHVSRALLRHARHSHRVLGPRLLKNRREDLL